VRATFIGHRPARRALVLVPVLGVVLLGVGFLVFRTSSRGSGCDALRDDRVLGIGSQRIHAQVADTPDAIGKGLGGRNCIDANRGMLFVFQQAGLHQFWMKGMRFPIDMVWIDDDHEVVWLERDVSPSTYPMSFFNREDPARYVLELKAGRSSELGLEQGSRIGFS
jgi:uncharacterized membrane protein (UPF0127 family)